jgi:hypothetical protein
MRVFFFYFAVLSLLTFSCFSQPYKIRKGAVRQTVGYNHKSDSSIVLSGDEFPGEIIQLIKLDSTSTNSDYLVFIDTKKPHSVLNHNIELVMIYNFNENACRLVKEFSYSDVDLISIKDNMFMYFDGVKFVVRDLYSWKVLYKLNQPYLAFNTKNTKAFSYITETLSRELQSFKGVDVETGKTIWQKSVEDEKYVRGFCFSDSSAYIMGDDFVTSYGFDNGFGWKVPINNYLTTQYSYTLSDVGLSIVGMISGYFTGFYFYSLGTYTKVFTTGSNLYYDSGKLFFATADSIFCVNSSTGTRIWQNPLPKSGTRITRLLINEDKVYLVNMGFGGDASKKLEICPAYIAEYDRTTGKYLRSFSFEEENTYFRNFIINGHNLLFRSRTDFLLVSLDDMQIASSLPISRPDESTVELSDDLFYFDDTLRLFKQIPDSFFIVDNCDGYVQVYDNSLSLTDDLKKDNVTKAVEIHNDFTIFQTGNDIHIVNKSGEMIASFYKSEFIMLSGNQLYIRNVKTVFSASIESLLN